MKNFVLIFFLLTSISFSAQAKARIPVCIPCEYIETTVDLPEDTEFIGELNDPLNVGYRYKQINIIWIPLWNYDGEYCLVNNSEDTYYDLTEEEKAYLTEKHNASFEGSPLSFWNKMGGKLILIGILLFVLWGYFSPDDDTEENQSASTES